MDKLFRGASGPAPLLPLILGHLCDPEVSAPDHDGLREIALEVLTNLGYRVLVAADGEQALREFQAHCNSIDLALLDVMLPKASGPEIHERISAEMPDLPVIFATGYSADSSLLRQVEERGLPVIQKPYTPRDLARKVREVLDKKSSTVTARIASDA